MTGLCGWNPLRTITIKLHLHEPPNDLQLTLGAAFGNGGHGYYRAY